MDIVTLQEGLLNWFWLSPLETKRLPAIENICNKLYEQYFPERLKAAKYEIFYPLLKYGLIEFYGDNSYALSPSSGVFNDDLIALINIPEILLNKVEPCIFEYKFGIKLYRNSGELLSFLDENKIPSSKYNLRGILKQIPSLDSIVNLWKDDSVNDVSNYFYLTKSSSWATNNIAPMKGVYKKTQELYSQRGVKVSENKWKRLPSRGDNIDAFNIAILWKQIQNDENVGVKFQVSRNIVLIENIFLPVVIERLLFLNTILQPINSIEVFKRQYIINRKEFEILNKLLGNKIQLI